jgi:hypothetical protein
LCACCVCVCVGVCVCGCVCVWCACCVCVCVCVCVCFGNVRQHTSRVRLTRCLLHTGNPARIFCVAICSCASSHSYPRKIVQALQGLGVTSGGANLRRHARARARESAAGAPPSTSSPAPGATWRRVARAPRPPSARVCVMPWQLRQMVKRGKGRDGWARPAVSRKRRLGAARAAAPARLEIALHHPGPAPPPGHRSNNGSPIK